ncbi:MAG: class I SAM-dependent methyltransferase [Shewanella sp.]|nr:class I SAM-dependent methyltransferase [Shewanella sp.]MCF1431776.1 class I SAM-dependent methyltransferase [Shewanella sp.]MCF1437972.1 class I SAM-dependent methyltransferase [Shewanella sp.]MCF1458746.1 class I SAM-dependent methyltransferase [Shewanella sp.]
MPDLLQHFPWSESQEHILDLACGTGHRGLQALQHGHIVTFIDKDLGRLLPQIAEHPNAILKALDLEAGNPELGHHQYDAIWVFNYLCRPLMPVIADALKPGGMLVYETFTREQASIGKPSNPAFLLNKNELRQIFANWQRLHYFEGYLPGLNQGQFKAQLIAHKPDSD